jgi:hypothetical protein
MKRTDFDAPAQQVYGLSSSKDIHQWDSLESILENFQHSESHILTHWPCYTRRINVLRFLAHFKLFEKTQDLPGDIVEIGVSRGVSLFTWHKFLEIFSPTDTSKKVIGIDSFEGLQSFHLKDGKTDPSVGKCIEGWSAGKVEDEVDQLAAWHNADNVIARERVVLKKGRVEDVLGQLMEDRPGMRISLLHLDVDLYEPTLYALRKLWDLVVPGGVIVLDEYGLPPWGGEASAVDEFLQERSMTNLRIQKFSWSLTPNGFIIKGS